MLPEAPPQVGLACGSSLTVWYTKSAHQQFNGVEIWPAYRSRLFTVDVDTGVLRVLFNEAASLGHHLVTFTIDEEDDVHTVEDAIRKLSMMDAKGRIWIQEMVLQVNSSSVKLLDVDSKEELEVFLIPAIQRCNTFLPENRHRSLLALVCQERYQPRPDVHFFQCDDIGVELICEDINSAVSDSKTGDNAKRPAALRNTQEKISQQSTSGSNSYLPQTSWKPQTHYITPAEILQRESQRRAGKPSNSSLNPQIIINPVPQMQQQSGSSAKDDLYSQVIRQEKSLQIPQNPQMQQKSSPGGQSFGNSITSVWGGKDSKHVTNGGLMRTPKTLWLSELDGKW
ncbi:unnamed protein product [Ranitomeya imitator]|uniref:PID domain-containing protein n=1 Tax=Ranitomeya imitator TaxID=111125 RepID=A0ABN9M3C4_9NEOB|nr:unnamed protein product [Ranitomeya imitator]